MNVKMTTIDNNNNINNLTSPSSIEMKDTNNENNIVNNENDINNKIDDNQQTMNVENSVNVHFQIRQEANGQIAYKMVPIAQNEVIVANFNNGNQNHIITNNSNDSDSKILSNLDTSVYFMVQTPDIVQTNKLITKSSSTNKIYSNNSSNKTVRDERRRANHNEVERRRRDNINKWIVELSKVIPDCSNDHTKHGQSKGGILEKTVQYLIDMKLANENLTEHIKNLEKLKIENELLKQENENYKKENQYLRLQLDRKVSTTSNGN